MTDFDSRVPCRAFHPEHAIGGCDLWPRSAPRDCPGCEAYVSSPLPPLDDYNKRRAAAWEYSFSRPQPGDRT